MSNGAIQKYIIAYGDTKKQNKLQPSDKGCESQEYQGVHNSQ